MHHGGRARPIYFVRDNGVGFDPTYASKLFQPFQRLHTPSSRAPGSAWPSSTGSSADTRGGFWGDSAPGEGATFLFTLSPL